MIPLNLYKPLQYIESTGTQYIDTGIVPNGTDNVSIKRKHVGTGGTTSSYFGCMSSASSPIPRFSFGKYSSSGVKSFCGFNITQIVGDADTNWHTDRVFYENSTYYVQRDNETAISYAPLAQTQSTLSAYIFARHGTSGVQTYDGEGTAISYIDWKDVNGKQRAYFIPAQRISDSSIGMYDDVTGEFFANAGNGSFVAGPEDYSGTVAIRNTENLFDMKYDVSYQGSYPNITEVEGGKSTEWIETSKFTNPYGYYSINPATPSALCVFGLVYSNDKSTILYRDGRRNTADLPANTQYFGTTAIDKTYTYVKFYISRWDTVNNAGVYISSQSEYIPCIAHSREAYINDNGTIKYCEEAYTNVNGTPTKVWKAGYPTEVSSANPVQTDVANAREIDYKIYGNTKQGELPEGPACQTPSAPLEIKFVGDRTEQLWNPMNKINAYISTSVGSTAPIQADSAGSKGYWFPIEDGETYALYGSQSNRCRIGLTMEQPDIGVSALCIYVDNDDVAHNFIFTNSNNYKYCFVQTCNSGVEPEVFNAVKGSSAPTSYIPYGYKVPILQAQNCGCADLSTLNWTLRGSGTNLRWYSTSLNGTVKNNSTMTVANAFLNGFKAVTSGQVYSHSYDYSFGLMNSDECFSIYASDLMGMTPTEFKQYMSGKYLYYQRTTDSSWTAPTITPIYTQSPIYKVGTYADTLLSAGLVNRKVGVKVLDGTNLVVTATGWENGVACRHSDLGALAYASGGTADTFKCSHLSVIGGSDTDDTLNITSATYGIRFNFDSTVIPPGTAASDRVAVVNAWLAAQYAAGTPVIIYYPLATPTTETIETPTISTVKGTNIFDVETSVKPSNMTIDYVKRCK